MRSLRSSSVVGVVPVLLSALLVGHTAVGQPLKPQRMKAQALLTTRAKLVPLKAAPPAGTTAIGRRPQDVIVAKVTIPRAEPSRRSRLPGRRRPLAAAERLCRR